jgi:hypothetical protein
VTALFESLGVPPRRILSWFVSSAFTGWFVVYNLLRAFGGQSPRGAALPSLLFGGVLGGLAILAGVVAGRRWIAAREPGAAAESGSLTAGASPRPGALQALSIACGFAAVAAVLVGSVLLAQWISAEPDARSITLLIVAVWCLPVGLWLGAEAIALRTRDARGVEIMSSAGVVSVLLGGVALTQNSFVGGQVALILTGAALAILSQLALPRHAASALRWVAPIGTAATAVLAIVLPLVNR